MLSVKSLTKKFGEIIALDNVDIDIDDGEFVFITGPSGAGKTTLLKILLREITPDSGEIILDGEDIAKLPDKKVPQMRQKFGVVFQDFKVLPEQTVSENIEIALAVIGLPKTEWKARIDHVLKLVGLFERLDLFPSQLSGGELQRVSLARALVVNPKIVLADEPTGNLDWDTAEKIMDLLELVNKEGKTIIMATHNKVILEKHKKRVINLVDGKVIEDTKKKVDISKKENKIDKSEEMDEDNKKLTAKIKNKGKD